MNSTWPNRAAVTRWVGLTDTIKVRGKRLLLLEVHPSVTEPVGLRANQGKQEYPFRQGRIKTWQPCWPKPNMDAAVVQSPLRA